MNEHVKDDLEIRALSLKYRIRQVSCMTTAQIIKSNGFKSLAQFSKIVDVPVSTLKDWRKNRPVTFGILIAGAVVSK